MIAFGATLLWLWPLVADAQVFVYPRRSSQTNVRWHDFDWNHIEIMVGPKASGETIEDPGPRLHNRMGGTDHDHGADQAGLLRGPHKKASPSDWPAGRSLQSAPGGGLAQNPATSSQGGDQPEESEAEEVDEDDDVSPWSGGIKLYFYESEREIAEQAAAFIERHYRQLVDDFEYVPDKTFPYFLYSSYHEFLQTNLFPIQEGVLGVTSPESLEVTLPYFGDHAQFADVSKHELVHEFTIQKVEAYAEKNNAADNPLTKMPLWFIEGIAEYYAKDGLDAETETLVRDLVVNPDPDEEYVLEGFFDQKRRGYLWTYKLGQARAAFLEETYGDGTLQTIIEESYRLVGTNDGRQRMRRFPELLTEVTGDSRRTLSQKFENWLKRRHFRTYLDAEQPPGVFEQYEA
ncbi:MAG: tolB protein precursor protein, partial [Persicimonas sp.]